MASSTMMSGVQSDGQHASGQRRASPLSSSPRSLGRVLVEAALAQRGAASSSRFTSSSSTSSTWVGPGQRVAQLRQQPPQRPLVGGQNPLHQSVRSCRVQRRQPGQCLGVKHDHRLALDIPRGRRRAGFGIRRQTRLRWNGHRSDLLHEGGPGGASCARGMERFDQNKASMVRPSRGVKMRHRMAWHMSSMWTDSRITTTGLNVISALQRPA
jgi:hypothetical protein